jgi:hypothetical protein
VLREWFWQLAAAANGPDWLFSATFDAADASALERRARDQPLPGFAYLRVADRPCQIHPEPHAYDVYIDTRNATALAANIAGQASRNL